MVERNRSTCSPAGAESRIVNVAVELGEATQRQAARGAATMAWGRKKGAQLMGLGDGSNMLRKRLAVEHGGTHDCVWRTASSPQAKGGWGGVWLGGMGLS